VNFIEVPFSILGVAGVTAIDTKRTFETVRVVDPVMAPKIAVIVVLPVAALVASPCELIAAAAGLEDVQTTVVVTS